MRYKQKVGVKRSLAAHTNILVPYVLHRGLKESCPVELGESIIMKQGELMQRWRCSQHLESPTLKAVSY